MVQWPLVQLHFGEYPQQRIKIDQHARYHSIVYEIGDRRSMVVFARCRVCAARTVMFMSRHASTFFYIFLPL